jgi:hypothetical protein
MVSFPNGSTVFSVSYELNLYIKFSLILVVKWLKYHLTLLLVLLRNSKLHVHASVVIDHHHAKHKNFIIRN